MRIGELANGLGVTADTIRFYEKEGWLPGPRRAENSYRDYTSADAEHIRLLLDLRGLDLSLADASRLAAWCHSGHCDETTRTLPVMLARQRAIVAERIERLEEVDARLAKLETHLTRSAGPSLPVLSNGGPCCDAAAAVGSPTGCACCTPA